ncbi:uncharacterized protein LOC125332627 [Corvus hawaiiensis]|uniref:uncharacterized protein LOC125332627 n=1 Tax=Corvus hawaiiensis TaxID=134902 RepID=UPI002019344F|nr:uncharacterized protein LOC125332627 [Corvus hawaiiensis]
MAHPGIPVPGHSRRCRSRVAKSGTSLALPTIAEERECHGYSTRSVLEYPGAAAAANYREQRLDSRVDNLWRSQGRAFIPLDESSSGITIPGAGSARTTRIPALKGRRFHFQLPAAGTNSSVCCRFPPPPASASHYPWKRSRFSQGGEFGATFTHSEYEVNVEHIPAGEGIGMRQLLPVGKHFQRLGGGSWELKFPSPSAAALGFQSPGDHRDWESLGMESVDQGEKLFPVENHFQRPRRWKWELKFPSPGGVLASNPQETTRIWDAWEVGIWGKSSSQWENASKGLGEREMGTETPISEASNPQVSTRIGDPWEWDVDEAWIPSDGKSLGEDEGEGSKAREPGKRPGWLRLGTAWNGGNCPCPWNGMGLRSLPTKAFQDSVSFGAYPSFLPFCPSGFIVKWES